MTYSQKLRDPRWQRKRLQILERDDWKCRCCGNRETTLQVHHLYYAKLNPWDYRDDAYQTLCEPCHKKRQSICDPMLDQIRVVIGRIPTAELYRVLDGVLQKLTFDVSLSVFETPQADDSKNTLTPEQGRKLFKSMLEACK